MGLVFLGTAVGLFQTKKFEKITKIPILARIVHPNREIRTSLRTEKEKFLLLVLI
jgi:hypothetical protein